MSEGKEQTQAVAQRDRTPLSQRDPVQLADIFVQSGFFKDTTDKAKAIVKMVAGEELGLGPMASMQNINIIEGQPAYSGNLIATKIKQDPDCDYRLIEHTAEKCEIAFYEHGEEVGRSAFTFDEASKITNKHGKPLVEGDNWRNYPEAMLFNRCISKGQKMHIPQVTSGLRVYTPEELQEAGPIETEVLDGEVVSDNGDGPTEPDDAGEDVTDAEPEPETISKAAAERLYEDATASLAVEPESFARAAAFVLDRPVDVSTKKAATEALSQATPDQAAQISAWIERQHPAEAEESTQGEGGESNE